MKFEVHVAELHIHVHGMEAALASLLKLNQQGELIMTTVQDLKDEILVLRSMVAKEKEETKQALLAAVKPLTDQIAALKEQIALGSPATTEDLDDLRAQLKLVEAGIEDITVPAAVVEPAVVQAPPGGASTAGTVGTI